jgi:hypothetical protein
MLIVLSHVLATLSEAALRVFYLTVKVSTLNPTSSKTPVTFTHACFSPIYLYAITFANLRVDCPSCGLIVFLHIFQLICFKQKAAIPN